MGFLGPERLCDYVPASRRAMLVLLTSVLLSSSNSMRFVHNTRLEAVVLDGLGAHRRPVAHNPKSSALVRC